jgi:hypothetical protein
VSATADTFRGTLEAVERILNRGGDADDVLRQVVEVLHDRVGHYSWVGIYLVEGNDLVLGPWKGPEATEHVRIPIGQGICGAAAASGQTEVVDDVNSDPRRPRGIRRRRSRLSRARGDADLALLPRRLGYRRRSVERDPVTLDRRRTWGQRPVQVALAGGVVVVASAILLVVVLAKGGGDGGERITFADFEGGLFDPGDVDNRQFHATCAPGRLIVEFSPDDEMRITREGGELIAALDSRKATVGCSGRLADVRGWGFYVAGLTHTQGRAARLECITRRPVQLVAHPIFRGDTDAYGGSVALGVPVADPDQYPRALIIASFTEDGRAGVSYRSPPCRITES